MKTFKQYFTEHHKLGAMYKPFNILQSKVFLSLYDKLYGHDNLSNTAKLSKIITTTPAAKIFGDEMSHNIPDEKILHPNRKDIIILVNELLKRIRK